MQNPLIILRLIYFATACIVFFVHLFYQRRLKELYPDLSAALYPDMVPRNPVTNLFSRRKWWGFIMRREYRSLDNPRFVKLCDCFRILVLSFYLFSAVMIILVFTSNR